jgi:LPXTG-site transpeptidase (sortase) family protein
LDLRVDPSGNYVAQRAETLFVLVSLRNISWTDFCNVDDPNSPQVGPNFPEANLPVIPAGQGQDLEFLGITLDLSDGDNNFLSVRLTPENFINSYTGQSLADANGLIKRAPTLSADPNAFRKIAAEDYYAIVPFNVPGDATLFVEARTSNLDFKCTGGPCASFPQIDDVELEYYSAPIGGLWIYKTGDDFDAGFPTTTPPGGQYNPYNNNDPFQLVHLVGSPTGRRIGQEAWFVLEVRNRWEADKASGTDSRSIRSIGAKSGSPLPACAGSPPDGVQGWYSSVAISPTTGPITGPGTLKLPNSGPGSIGDLQLGGGDAVYCVFKLELSAGAGGIFAFRSTLEGLSYTNAIETLANRIDIPVDISIQVAGAALQVEKTIIDPVEGNPPAPKLVRPGDVITYRITLTNVGEVELNNLRFLDSLTGPYVFEQGVTLSAPTSLNPFSCSGVCSQSVDVVYTVGEGDPNPIFNTVTAYGRISGTALEVTALDSAAILQAENELQLTLTARGNVNAVPQLGVDTSVIYTLTYANNSDQTFSNLAFVGIPGAPAGTFYPSLKNPGSIEVYLPDRSAGGGSPGYPQIAAYSDTPPNTNSLQLRPPFPPGATFPPIVWEYNLPPLPPVGSPLTAYPLFQEVVIEATRQDGTQVRGQVALATEVDNPNLSLNATLWDSSLNQVRTTETILRGETLTFNLEAVLQTAQMNPGEQRCDVRLRQYVLDAGTGIQTLVNPDIQLNWPAAPNQLPAGTFSTNSNGLRPTYTVQDISPDPLIVIFEFDARKGCPSYPDRQNFIDRVVLQYDVSNINIDTQLLIVTNQPNSTTQVTQGVYPRTALSADPEYQLLYRATNQGPLNPDIIDWGYCIVDSPVLEENCAENTTSMYDGRENGYPDFGVNENTSFGDISRKFATFPPRLDRRLFSLQRGLTYPNPLVIQVILQVSETGNANDITTVRDFVIFPLAFDDLNLTLDTGGRTTVVRGDHDVPIRFTFQNTGDTPLKDVQVLDLTALAPGGGFLPASSEINPTGPYRRCEYDGGALTLSNLQPAETASGTCFFDFTEEVVLIEGALNFRVAVVAKEDTTDRDVFDIEGVNLGIVPHLAVIKEGPSGGLTSDPIDYTVEITNNSEFQYVDFDNLTGFIDVFTPELTSSDLCILDGSPNAPLCPTIIPEIVFEHIAGVIAQPNGRWRLPERIPGTSSGIANIAYRLLPRNGSHGNDKYVNVATVSGNREYAPAPDTANEILVSGSDNHELELRCPIVWTIRTRPAGPGRGEDLRYSLGEEVVVTIEAYNLSASTIIFDELYDPRWVQDGPLTGVNSISFRDLPQLVWPRDVNPAIPDYTLPPFDPVTGQSLPLRYTFNFRVNTPDFDVPPGGFSSYIYEWVLKFETSGVPDVGGCTYSGRNLSDAQSLVPYVANTVSKEEHRLVGFFISSALRNPKNVDLSRTNLPILAEGQPIKYVLSIYNISETTDIKILNTEETLFEDRVLYRYCLNRPSLVNNLPVCNSSSDSVEGTLWRDNFVSPVWDIRPAVGLEVAGSEPGVGGLPLYFFDREDLAGSPDPNFLANRSIIFYEPIVSSGPSWLTLQDLGQFNEELVPVLTPLVVTETVISPINRIVASPGVVDYFISVNNVSEYPVQGISLSNSFGAGFVYPICGVTPGFIPAPDLEATPNVCLPQMPFNLNPFESVAVIVSLPVSDSTPNPIETRTIANNARVVIEGVPYLLDPPPTSGINIVQIDKPNLTIKQQLFGDPSCSLPLVNITTPPRDVNADGIPEMEVGGNFFLGIQFFVEVGRNFTQVEVEVDLETGNPALSNAVMDQLADLAEAGTNPAVGGNRNNLALNDVNPADSAIPDLTLCTPQPDGFQLLSRRPDPLSFATSISGLETRTQIEVSFSTEDEPLLESEKGLYVEKNLVLDVTDPFLFITKTVEPTTAFPGEVVTYTLAITNKTNQTIRVNDVWDSNIGLGQQFFDYDNNPDTPPQPLQFQVDGKSSIDFLKLQSQAPIGLGWSWATPGIIPPNTTVTYLYERQVTDLDPNPLINLAGVLGYIDNPEPEADVVVQDETLNSLIVSNSQLNVVKTAQPTSTILGRSIAYEITVTNISDDPIYDIIVWDDRYNLQYADERFISLIPKLPAQTDVLVVGGALFPAVGGTDASRLDLGGQLSPQNFSRSVSILYNLPVPPDCVAWTNQPNQPYNPVTRQATFNNNSNPCQRYTGLSQLPLIDPFINQAFAVGLGDEDGDGDLEYISNIGFDRAVVDIINENIRLEKIPEAKIANVGADFDYTLRVTNTSSSPLRIDRLFDRVTATESVDVKEMTFGDCPVPSGVSTTPSVTNFQNTKLLVFLANPGNPQLANPTNITLNQTAILFPGCTASAVVTVQIPNPLPDNDYINVAEVEAVNFDAGQTVRDLSYARINLTATGLEITKRAWNCNTAPNGAQTPTVLPNGTVCTVRTAVGGVEPGAQQVIEANEGQQVFFELSILNSGTVTLNSLRISDVMLLNQNGSLVPYQTRVPDNTEWRDRNSELYRWQNGVLSLGFAEYKGFGKGTCGPEDGGGHQTFDETYNCFGNYRGYNRGPFGQDDPATTDRDESYLLDSNEVFERPDPGPVDIPVITYPYTVKFPDDDLDFDETFVNRALITSTAYDPDNLGLLGINNQATHTLGISPSSLQVTVEACAERDGNPNTPDFSPCTDVVKVGGDVWYRITLLSKSQNELENIQVSDLIRGLIPSTDSCWTWPGAAGVLQRENDVATCAYRRDAVTPTPPPITAANIPVYTNIFTINFDIDTGTPPALKGTTIFREANINVAESDLVLSIPGCESPIRAPANTPITLDVLVRNINALQSIDGIQLFAPNALGDPFNLPVNNSRLFEDLLSVSLDPLVDELTITLTGRGTINTTPPTPVNGVAVCRIQRADGDLFVQKTVVNPATGGNSARPGDTVTYTITAENLNQTLVIRDFQMRDLLLETAPLSAGAWASSWPTSLAPQTSITRSFTYLVPGDNDPIINTATGIGNLGGFTPTQSSASARLNITTSDLLAVITPSSNPLVAGETLVFNYQICNLSAGASPKTYLITTLEDNDLSGTPIVDMSGQPYVDGSLTLAPQACAYFKRVVSTTAADAGTIISRTLGVVGCPQGQTCPPAASVSDSQRADVDVIGESTETAGVDIRLVADRLGVAPGDLITYRLRMTNLNTEYPATLTISPDAAFSLPDNIFANREYVLQPQRTAEYVIPYLFPGTADPLVAQVRVRTLLNGVTTERVLELTLPVASVPGSKLLLNVDSLEDEATPGGFITYTYTLINISNQAIEDAYLYDPYFIPANTLTGLPSISSCVALTADDNWGLGNPKDGLVANRVPILYANGYARTARVRCQVDKSFSLMPPNNLIHVMTVNRTSVNSNPALARQDVGFRQLPIVPPLVIEMSSFPAAPGGLLRLQFAVENIGFDPIDQVVVRAPDLPAECKEAAWLNQRTFTAIGNSSSQSLWTGATLAAGEILIATADCTVREDVMPAGQQSTSFTYPATDQDEVQVLSSTVLFDVAEPIQISVVDLVRFSFIPPANNPTMAFVRANDFVQFGFRLQNSSQAGASIEGIEYSITVGGQPCDSTAVTASNGQAFNGTLARPGDSAFILCSLIPKAGDNGKTLPIVFTATYLLNGQRVPIPVPNPIASPVVEDIGLSLTLGTGTGGSTTSAQVSDGTSISYTLLIKNTGQTPLLLTSFSQSMLDLVKGGEASGKSAALGDLVTAYAAVCPGPLLPGATCTLTATTSLLNYRVLVTDPQRFTFKVTATAQTNSGSNQTTTASAQWTGTVTRPIVELPGGTSSVNVGTSGNVWIVRPENAVFTPNPVVNGGTASIQVTIRNTGFQTLTENQLTGTVSLGQAMEDSGDPRLNGLDLTSRPAQSATATPTATSTLPLEITFTLPTSLAPGETAVATAQWNAQGFSSLPTFVNLRMRYRATVAGGVYPAYDVTLAPVNVEVVAAASTGTTTAGTTAALDPNATEPVITKQASVDSAFPGDSILWTVTVTNRHTADMVNVTLTDPVPGDLTVVDVSSTAGAAIANGNVVSVTLGTLTPGQSVTVTISTTVNPEAIIPGVATNTACGSREGGQEVCASAEVALGPGGILPDTGLNSPAYTQPNSTLGQKLPFWFAMLATLMGLLMLSVHMSQRQRAILALLALAVIGLLVISLLMLGAEGDSDPDRTAQEGEGAPPAPPVQEGLATATPLPALAPTETPTLVPTVAPEILATIQSFPPTATPYIPPTPAGPRRLNIPALNYAMPIPIVELPQYNNEWDVSNLGHNIGWLDNTTWLDPDWGNTVLVGHIQLSDTDPGPFNQLDRLVPGDEIQIIEGGQVMLYEVTEIFTAPPTASEVTHPTLSPTLTLITCTNWSDDRGVFSDRLIVRAVPLVNEIAGGG